jgi:rhodanese-related sulfurtransferase
MTKQRRAFPRFGLAIAATLRDLLSQRRPRKGEGDPSWIEPSDLADRLEREPRPLIIDVRGPDEFAGELGHLAGARNIPLSELPQHLRDLGRFREHQVVLVCRTQMRSAKAAALLQQAGFRDVAVLRGGMVEWARRKSPARADAAAKPR